PFITEELWQRLGERAGGRDEMLILSEWPELDGLSDEWAAQELDWVIHFVSEVRSVRSEMNVPAGALVPLVISGADPGTRANAEGYDDTLKRLARIEKIDFADEPPKGTVQIVLGEATVALRLEGIIDIAEETARLQREIAKVGSEIEKLSAKLSNEQFVSRAPEHVVEEQRERKADAEAAEARLKEALKRIEVAL
ncbi:MAG: class I tRNA ligase family protein, partial [Hyphomicrobiales bacterium]|nr:class I tRNA ligase family protein [Hyphomicrobiales bacterium]